MRFSFRTAESNELVVEQGPVRPEVMSTAAGLAAQGDMLRAEQELLKRYGHIEQNPSNPEWVALSSGLLVGATEAWTKLIDRFEDDMPPAFGPVDDLQKLDSWVAQIHRYAPAVSPEAVEQSKNILFTALDQHDWRIRQFAAPKVGARNGTVQLIKYIEHGLYDQVQSNDQAADNKFAAELAKRWARAVKLARQAETAMDITKQETARREKALAEELMGHLGYGLPQVSIQPINPNVTPVPANVPVRTLDAERRRRLPPIAAAVTTTAILVAAAAPPAAAAAAERSSTGTQPKVSEPGIMSTVRQAIQNSSAAIVETGKSVKSGIAISTESAMEQVQKIIPVGDSDISKPLDELKVTLPKTITDNPVGTNPDLPPVKPVTPETPATPEISNAHKDSAAVVKPALTHQEVLRLASSNDPASLEKALSDSAASLGLQPSNNEGMKQGVEKAVNDLRDLARQQAAPGFKWQDFNLLTTLAELVPQYNELLTSDDPVMQQLVVDSFKRVVSNDKAVRAMQSDYDAQLRLANGSSSPMEAGPLKTEQIKALAFVLANAKWLTLSAAEKATAIGQVGVFGEGESIPEQVAPTPIEPPKSPGQPKPDAKPKNDKHQTKPKHEERDRNQSKPRPDRETNKGDRGGRYAKLLNLIAGPESGGNYNAYYGEGDNQRVKFTSMSIGEVMDWQRNFVRKGSESSAVGKYQFLVATLTSLVDQYNIPLNSRFDQKMQDELAVHLLEKRDLRGYLKGDISAREFAHKLSMEWASLPRVIGGNPEASYYAGDGLNHSFISVKTIMDAVESIKERREPREKHGSHHEQKTERKHSGIFETKGSLSGAERVKDRATSFTRMSSAELSAICEPGQGDACYHRCARLAARAWGYQSSGYSTAAVQWQAAKSSGEGHEKDRSLPVGALLFYHTGEDAGHVAVYLGNNKVLSNDVMDKSERQGGAYIVDASELEGGAWNLTYLGWAPPNYSTPRV